MAVAVAVAAVTALGGCSDDGAGNGAPATPDASASPSASTGTASPTNAPSGTATEAPGTPSPGQTPNPGTSVTPEPAPSTSAADPAPAPSASTPAAGETLVAVTRSGGIAGKTATLIIKGHGSFLRLNAKAETVDRGKLSAAALTKLRTALQKADFPRLPRISMPKQPVFDSFTYAFRHGGYEVAADQTTLPQPLEGVLGALPSFEPS